MQKFIIISITLCCLTACGSAKKDGIAKKDGEKTLILPPDVNSNKYSKKRFRN